MYVYRLRRKFGSVLESIFLGRQPFYLRVDFYLFLVSVCLFVSLPQLDMVVSRSFYDPATQGFPLGEWPLLEVVYRVFAKIQFPLLLVLLPMSLFGRAAKADAAQSGRRRLCQFLLVSLLLGPGILTNIVIKDHSFGRARPNDTVSFGGEAKFTRAFEYSGVCPNNCSFVSGHAAMGFYFIGLGWVFRSALGFWLGVAIGGAVGLTRIMQGGHFLSDVVFAFWVVHFCYAWLGRRFDLPHPLGESLVVPARYRRMLVSLT
jgi:lipid A 4'-phosphatase